MSVATYNFNLATLAPLELVLPVLGGRVVFSINEILLYKSTGDYRGKLSGNNPHNATEAKD